MKKFYAVLRFVYLLFPFVIVYFFIALFCNAYFGANLNTSPDHPNDSLDKSPDR